MRVVKEIQSQQATMQYQRIAQLAFPDLNVMKWPTLKVHPNQHLYGLYENDQLLGGMRLFDFDMNVYGQYMPTGGLGLLAVDLLHKKEKVARDLVQFFIEYYRQQNAAWAMLHPFNTHFYKQMGFGTGTEVRQYHVKPEAFPSHGSKAYLVHLTDSDKPNIMDCYNRFAAHNHGLFYRPKFESELNRSYNAWSIIGYRSYSGRLTGYLIYSFQNDQLLIHEFVYESPAELKALSRFLYDQRDQVDRIVLNTTDEAFYFLLDHPENGYHHMTDGFIADYHESYIAGVGPMYRVLNIKMVLESYGQQHANLTDTRFKLTINDPFMTDVHGDYWVTTSPEGIEVSRSEQSYDFAMKIGISEFSSLMMGTASFQNLYQIGLVELSDPEAYAVIQAIFPATKKPMCMTAF
ncbi:GNAT family N-acetyltransferase [Tuberibacillus sp. Marseille-P3662]|uniref:GNAT family N-acetyltransferase n=1 Tax=Tuberibacillus sp. Marseille-P3662 TaxID=1965358 RepID=UPI000A1CD231|nr:GNAT family N-acetyltransferase [Tuberibacillus sp. Marseille-P3662]